MVEHFVGPRGQRHLAALPGSWHSFSFFAVPLLIKLALFMPCYQVELAGRETEGDLLGGLGGLLLILSTGKVLLVKLSARFW